MQINQDNCIAVANWLLQCDPMDFKGPLERIQEWYEALGDVYVAYHENQKTIHAVTCSEKIKMMILSQLLFKHLNPIAKKDLKQKLKYLAHFKMILKPEKYPKKRATTFFTEEEKIH